MSNLLVRILAIILLIGVTIAAFVYLGPKIQDAISSSRAATFTQTISQIESASTLQRQQESAGPVARTPVLDLRGKGYLKLKPENPLIDRGGLPYRLLYSKDLESDAYYADTVLVGLGQSEEAKNICRAINRKATGNDVIPELSVAAGPDVSSAVKAESGCFKMHDVGVPGEANPHDYVIYTKL